MLDYPEVVSSLTAEDVQEAAQQYLDLERFVEVVLYPEGEE